MPWATGVGVALEMEVDWSWGVRLELGLVSCWSCSVGTGGGGYLHWSVLCCGGIFAGLHFLGGLFCCCVSRCRVDLVKSRLCWPGRVESVGHGCGGVCDRLGGR
jgi:hypothetical protein